MRREYQYGENADQGVSSALFTRAPTNVEPRSSVLRLASPTIAVNRGKRLDCLLHAPAIEQVFDEEWRHNRDAEAVEPALPAQAEGCEGEHEPCCREDRSHAPGIYRAPAETAQ